MKFKLARQKILALSVVVCMGINVSIPALAADSPAAVSESTELPQENRGGN